MIRKLCFIVLLTGSFIGLAGCAGEEMMPTTNPSHASAGQINRTDQANRADQDDHADQRVRQFGMDF